MTASPAHPVAAARVEVVRRDPRARGRVDRPATRRGARPRRRERRRQVDAREDPRRRPPSRHGRRCASASRTSCSSGPAAARDAGIAIIYQEPIMFPDLTVAENIFIGRQPLRGGRRIDRGAMDRQAAEIFERLGVPSIPSGSRAASRSPSSRSSRSPRRCRSTRSVIVMDEPTAALSAVEVERLFGVVETLRASTAPRSLFISHRLEEVFGICQRVTVFRDGRLVVSRELAGLSADDLVRAMVGRDLAEHVPQEQNIGGVVLQVERLTPRGRVRRRVVRGARRRDRRARGARRRRPQRGRPRGLRHRPLRRRPRAVCTASGCARRRRRPRWTPGSASSPRTAASRGS